MPEQLIMERLAENLSRLKLPWTRQILPDTIKCAQTESWSYLTLLDRLLEEEVARKEQRRIESVLKLSGLPWVKTLSRLRLRLPARDQPPADRRTLRSVVS